LSYLIAGAPGATLLVMKKSSLSNSNVNVGPLLATMALVFTTYFAVALAAPAMPAAVHEILAAVPPSASVPTLLCANAK
jgi:hypothetical protein